MCRGDDPHIDRLVTKCPQSPHGPVLQQTQQLDLQREIHVPDFVEKQRSSLRGLDQTELPCLCVRKGPAFVPKKLRIEQLPRN